LLSQHDGRGGKSSSSNSGDGEKLGEPGEVGLSLNNLVLFGKLDVGVVEIPGSDNFTVSKSLHRVERLLVLSLFHEPSRRLGAEEDENGERDCRNESGSKLESPSDRSDILHDSVGTEE
jgi:hypothetical protein